MCWWNGSGVVLKNVNLKRFRSETNFKTIFIQERGTNDEELDWPFLCSSLCSRVVSCVLGEAIPFD